MRFSLKSTLALLVLLGIADYRLWRDTASQYEFPQAVLEEALFQQMADNQYDVKIQSVELISGDEPDELGLRLGVSEVFTPTEIHMVELDLKAYQVDKVVTFAGPCLRPSAPDPGRVYKSVLRKKLVGSSYSLPIPDVQSRAGYSPVRPIKQISWSNGTITLGVGLPITSNQGQDMLTGRAWPECET